MCPIDANQKPQNVKKLLKGFCTLDIHPLNNQQPFKMSKDFPPAEKHYTREQLFETILQSLRDQGIEHPTRQDLSGVDEFHVRGAEVSLELAREAGIKAKDKVLDIGCGIGGPSRMIAGEFGCHVTGIDITSEFIRTAKELSKLVGLEYQTNFLQGDATSLPFKDNVFDIAWTQHVQMNIQVKKQFYMEILRVLKPGGKFIYYDIFKGNDDPLLYPVPWADDDAISFLITTDELEVILEHLGFEKIQVKDQTPGGIAFFEEMIDRQTNQGSPKTSLQLLMGPSAKERMKNLLDNFKTGRAVIQSGMFTALR